MLKVLLLSLSRQYTVDGQYIPSLFIEPEVRHDKTSYYKTRLFNLNNNSVIHPEEICAAAEWPSFAFVNKSI